MATVDILHPLTSDSVSPNVEVVVAYDFQSFAGAKAAVATQVTITARLRSSTTGYDQNLSTTVTMPPGNAVDEWTVTFPNVTPNTADGDYVLSVTADTKPAVDDQESNILVTANAP